MAQAGIKVKAPTNAKIFFLAWFPNLAARFLDMVIQTGERSRVEHAGEFAECGFVD